MLRKQKYYIEYVDKNGHNKDLTALVKNEQEFDSIVKDIQVRGGAIIKSERIL